MVENKPMKILMTADTVGGVWTYCMELCKALAPHNVHVSLVTTGARLSSWQWEEVIELNNVKVYETDYLLEWMENPWRDIDESGDYLLKLENDIKPDLIHLNCYAYGSLAWKAPVVMVAHSDVYSWYISVKNDDPPSEWNEYFFRVKKGLENADMVIAPSNAMMDFVEKIYSPLGNKKVIYNARQPKLFTRGHKQDTIFSMGRVWDEAKNVKLLVDAAQQIKFPIKIAGENAFESNVLDLYHENVEYLGRLESTEIAKQLANASVYVLPAKYEPFGLSALEAALSGCALVLGDIPSLREIWGDSALYVKTTDCDALANSVKRLMNDKALMQEYASKAFAHAQQFNPAVMVRQYLQVYQKLSTLKNIETTA
jgi:glycogen(starch) synthase